MNQLAAVVNAFGDDFSAIYREIFRRETSQMGASLERLFDEFLAEEITFERKFADRFIEEYGTVELVKKVLRVSSHEDLLLYAAMKKAAPRIELIAQEYSRVMLDDAQRALGRIMDR
ncbi:hypothetical protein G5S34_04525 [Herbaspirillum frisingense]|uniref:hypothetical protein n=1 Tax=Herbaspirillum frisingense TaxID=92645 RepID=UPI00160257C1|nr:hypothetical protein [Herbaspirillum frisingense]QNB06107.1 hypothetical protein G5S34_04525 [Herbaspirillum frisingense]